MKDPSEQQRFQHRRQDRLIRERVHDTYKSKSKLPEPTVCPDCGAVYHQGRWTWLAKPARAYEAICSACHRLRDKYPAGYVTLGGAFLQDHKEEILNLVRREEAKAKAEHPLQRIMGIEEQGDEVVITTADIHLARGIGEAVHRACHGELEFHYIEEGNILRMRWKR